MAVAGVCKANRWDDWPAEDSADEDEDLKCVSLPDV